jgi:YgiT-type zinc finger domain-containing protein
MGDTDRTRGDAMKCTIVGCPGEYEDRKIVHTVRHEGRLVVIENVPAEVCSVCGDVLLRPDTIRQVEAILRQTREPDRMAPVYEYAS